ncbi:MAG: gliding motility protein RemB, partial [Flaviramulus sp.]|nr:gliding motility protein RemB [Flaviramulus sp.]
MKQFILALLLLVQFYGYTQNNSFAEKPPVFPSCDSVAIDTLKDCFNKTVFKLIQENFKVPEIVNKENYKGEMAVLFEVDTLGRFNIIFTNAIYDELKEEAKRVFSNFPKIEPATYNGRKTFKQYSIPIKIPLLDTQDFSQKTKKLEKIQEVSKLEQAAKSEFEEINSNLEVFENKAYNSQLNIQFTHSDYARFDRSMNLIGTNSHTASKPFVYEEVAPYYDFKTEKEKLKKETDTWSGKKFWNEHLVQLQSDDYWFTIDPIFDLEVGKDTDADFNSTYNNTRGVLVQGGLGKKFNFYASVFESQGRFAQYVNEYAESLKGFGPDPA